MFPFYQYCCCLFHLLYNDYGLHYYVTYMIRFGDKFYKETMLLILSFTSETRFFGENEKSLWWGRHLLERLEYAIWSFNFELIVAKISLGGQATTRFRNLKKSIDVSMRTQVSAFLQVQEAAPLLADEKRDSFGIKTTRRLHRC